MLYLAFSASPASATDDNGCDPFEGGEPQSSTKCPCSTYPDNRYYCASAVQYTVFEITEKVRALFLSILETIARVLWLAARFIANIAEALLRGQVWQAIREGILGQLQTVMGGSGGVLARVTGGGEGLFLLALLLSGLVMAFPLLGATRLVQPDRAILWGVVLFALFIGGTQGFDLTDAIENLRVHMIETIAEGDSGDSLIDLVSQPVGATQDEAQQLDTNDLMTLPKVMLQSHFIGLPEGSRCQGEGGGGDECQKYRVIAFETNIAGQDLEYMFAAVKYRPNVIDGRQKKYTSGVVRMVVTVLASLVLLLFGIVFALLTAASLVLIIFFFAMLPLGFFEFGGAVLSGLVRQYTSVVGLSLFIAVMVRLMEGVTGTIFGAVADFSDVLGLLTYLGMLLIVGLGLQMAVRTAWGLMDGTFTVLRASVQTVGSMAFGIGAGPLGKTIQTSSGAVKAAGSTVLHTAMATGAGMAVGGFGTAFMAGAGGLLSHSNTGNKIADVVETAVPSSLNAQVFTTAVRAKSGWDSTTGIVAIGDRKHEASTKKFLEGIHTENARFHPKWQAVDRGLYLTSDLNLLASAELSYFKHSNAPKARILLERTFGSHMLADEVLGAYEIQGKASGGRVRRVVEITQATADNFTQRGRALFDDRGNLTQDFKSSILEALSRAGVYNKHNSQQSAFVGRLVGASLRHTINIWDDPRAPYKLATDTLDPDLVEVQVEDLPAQYQLRDISKKMGWDKAKLAHAFAAIPQVKQSTIIQEQPVANELVEAWRQDEQFQSDDEASLVEAARLAILVSASAQVQQPQPVVTEQGNSQPPIAEVRRDLDYVVMSTPYSADIAQQFQDNFSDQDYCWNVDQDEWNIVPQQEAIARQILDNVAEENGWQVLESQTAVNMETEENTLEPSEISEGERITNPIEEPNHLESGMVHSAPISLPTPAEVDDIREEKTAPISNVVESQEDESLMDPTTQPTPPQDDRKPIPAQSNEADVGQDKPFTEPATDPAPVITAHTPLAPETHKKTSLKPSRSVSPAIVSRMAKHNYTQLANEKTTTPVPDNAQPVASTGKQDNEP